MKEAAIFFIGYCFGVAMSWRQYKRLYWPPAGYGWWDQPGKKPWWAKL